jgi:phosphoribosylaminoimidazole-succinocarboxamide synthase
VPEAATHVASGKVRELYALDDDRLLLVASDRISVFDVVLPTPIPDKGRVLTGLSAFWFARTRQIVPHHLLSLRPDGRSLECSRLEMLPLEFVVRGYLAGSGWHDYRRSGAVCGHRLPDGLREADPLPAPIVTPATKAASGHDENITEAEASGTRRPARSRSRSTPSAPGMPRRGESSSPTPSSSSVSTTRERSSSPTRR